MTIKKGDWFVKNWYVLSGKTVEILVVHQNHHRTRGFNNGRWAKVRSLKPSKTLAQLRLGFCHSKMSDLRGGGSQEGWMAPEKILTLDPCTDHNCHNFLQQKETHGHGMSWSKSEFHEFLQICYDKIMNPLRDTVLEQGHNKPLTLLGGRGTPRRCSRLPLPLEPPPCLRRSQRTRRNPRSSSRKMRAVRSRWILPIVGHEKLEFDDGLDGCSQLWPHVCWTWHAFPLLLDVTGTLRILRLYMALHLLRCILDLLVLLQPAVTSKFNMSIIQHAESELIL